MSSTNKAPINLIIVPAVITLAVTLLRLTGELMDWSPVLFSKSAGGGGAIIGIAWLVPIFGFYFARQLMKSNDGPAGLGSVFGYSFLGLVFCDRNRRSSGRPLHRPQSMAFPLLDAIRVRTRRARSCPHRHVLRHHESMGHALRCATTRFP